MTPMPRNITAPTAAQAIIMTVLSSLLASSLAVTLVSAVVALVTVVLVTLDRPEVPDATRSAANPVLFMYADKVLTAADAAACETTFSVYETDTARRAVAVIVTSSELQGEVPIEPQILPALLATTSLKLFSASASNTVTPASTTRKAAVNAVVGVGVGWRVGVGLVVPMLSASFCPLVQCPDTEHAKYKAVL